MYKTLCIAGLELMESQQMVRHLLGHLFVLFQPYIIIEIGSGNRFIHFPIFLMGNIDSDLEQSIVRTAFCNRLSTKYEAALNTNI